MGASRKVVHVIPTLLSREKTNFGGRVFFEFEATLIHDDYTIPAPPRRVRGSRRQFFFAPLLTSQFVGQCKSGLHDLFDHSGDLVQCSLNG